MSIIEIHLGAATHRLTSVEGKTLLDLAVESGIAVNYSCKRGDCGQCIGTLTNGEALPQNAALPSRIHNDIYLCNSVPCGDVQIRLPYFPELKEIPSLRSPAKVHELLFLSEDVVEVALRLPPTINFRFLPGQFVRLTNKEKVTRSYSLSAGPSSDKLLRIQVRRVQGGSFSDYLFMRAKSGDLLQLDGPHGHFFIRQSQQYNNTLFLATGTGIAPIFAMLSSLSDDQRASLGQIDVYWGNRHRKDEYLAERMQALSSQVGFRYWALHSRETASSVRHIQDLMAEHHPTLSHAAAFACGSNIMIDASRNRCVELGMPLDRFHSDPFTTS